MASGPAGVKSWEPILQPPTAPSRRSSRVSASSSRSTSSATNTRSSAGSRGGSGIGVILLQAAPLLFALEQRLDGADGRLGPVQRQVVGDVLGHRGTTDLERVLAGATVLRRVDHELNLPALTETH